MSNGFVVGNQSVAEREDEGTLVHVTDEGGKLLYHGEGKPVTIRVAGTYSKTYRRAEEQIRRRPFKAGKITNEKFYDETMEKAIACTLAWDGFVDQHGNPIELNKHNIAAVYEEYPWVYDLVWEAMDDHSRFRGGAGSAA